MLKNILIVVDDANSPFDFIRTYLDSKCFATRWKCFFNRRTCAAGFTIVERCNGRVGFSE